MPIVWVSRSSLTRDLWKMCSTFIHISRNRIRLLIYREHFYIRPFCMADNFVITMRTKRSCFFLQLTSITMNSILLLLILRGAQPILDTSFAGRLDIVSAIKINLTYVTTLFYLDFPSSTTQLLWLCAIFLTLWSALCL